MSFSGPVSLCVCVGCVCVGGGGGGGGMPRYTSHCQMKHMFGEGGLGYAKLKAVYHGIDEDLLKLYLSASLLACRPACLHV